MTSSLRTIQNYLAAGMKVFVSIAESGYASRQKDLDDLNVEYMLDLKQSRTSPSDLSNSIASTSLAPSPRQESYPTKTHTKIEPIGIGSRV